LNEKYLRIGVGADPRTKGGGREQSREGGREGRKTSVPASYPASDGEREITMIAGVHAICRRAVITEREERV